MKIKRTYPLFALAIFFLFNPNVNLIDVLPDCLAFLLLFLAIRQAAETVPYLAECKSSLIGLFTITLLKIPAFAVMQSNMGSGKDIVPLFTLVFAAIELILLYSAAEKGFKALGYIGERTDCRSVREPFGKGDRKCTPEALRIMTFIFFASRAALSLLPELLLLTPEDTSLRRRLTEAYPTVLVICIFVSLIVGVFWLVYAMRYAKAIKNGGDLPGAIRLISESGSIGLLGEKEKLKKLTSSLSLLAFSGFFIFDIAFSNFGGYNILPHFIYGIIMFCAVYNFTSDRNVKICLAVGVIGLSISSLALTLFNFRFFESFSYVDLSYSKLAKEAYLPIKISAVLETLFALFLLGASALASSRFIEEHTDTPPSDPSYTAANKKSHLRTKKKVLPLFILSSLIFIVRCADIFIKQSSEIIYSEVNPDGIATSPMPAIGTVLFFASVIYVIYSFVAMSDLKDEIKYKYDRS